MYCTIIGPKKQVKHANNNQMSIQRGRIVSRYLVDFVDGKTVQDQLAPLNVRILSRVLFTAHYCVARYVT